jgi:hypothetical protein
MAEPPDQMPAAGRGHLRASHADRERVVGILKAAFVQGRFTKDEFDLRVSQAFAARTYAELAALTADLPPCPPAAGPARPPAPVRRRPLARAAAPQPAQAAFPGLALSQGRSCSARFTSSA